MEKRTYWLSFCGLAKPDGEKFLGVVVVDVTRDEADAALLMRPEMYDREEGPWIAACVIKAWAAKCNPGGEVASLRIDTLEHFQERGHLYPREMLLAKSFIEDIDRAFDESANAIVN